MNKFKRSYKQMWAYARASKSVKKQTKWLRKIYNQKITEATKRGNVEAVKYLKGVRHRARQRVLKARKYGGLSARNWNIATRQDIEEMVTKARHSGGKGYDNHILIIDDNGNKIIAYEGTAIYDEIVQAKKSVLGENWDAVEKLIDEGV